MKPAAGSPAGGNTRAGQPAGTRGALLLGYSTNVHPGEDLAQVYRSLRQYTVPIRDRVFGRGAEAGLELRLGIGAARDLLRRSACEEFKAFLEESRLRIFSVNAYPLRDFHQKRVKEDVFRPPWTEAARARWTAAIAGLLARLLPEGVTGTVSTLGGSYRPWGHGPGPLRRMARRYLEVVESLEAIEESTGKRVVLAVEPEPDTTFEAAADLIAFYEDHLLPLARERWRGRPAGRTEEALRRYFTANVDTCHLSVVFRPPAEEVARLERGGLSVGKVHVSSALALPRPGRRRRAYAELRSLHEPRYLHQVRGVSADGEVVLRAADLDGLPRPAAARQRGRQDPLGAVREVRAHFHVPVHASRWRGLPTTQAETREAVVAAVRKRSTRQLVIETYTWPILAGEDDLVRGIAREFHWLLEVLREARPG